MAALQNLNPNVFVVLRQSLYELAVNASIEPGECQGPLTNIIAILRVNHHATDITDTETKKSRKSREMSQANLIAFSCNMESSPRSVIDQLAAKVRNSFHALPPTDWILSTDGKNVDNPQDEHIRLTDWAFNQGFTL